MAKSRLAATCIGSVVVPCLAHHFVGVVVQLPSKPEVNVLGPLPLRMPEPQVPGQGLSGDSLGSGPGPMAQAPALVKCDVKAVATFIFVGFWGLNA